MGVGPSCLSKDDHPKQYPIAFTAEDLADVGIGEIKSSPTGCGAFSGTLLSDTIPNLWGKPLTPDQIPKATDADHIKSCKERGFKYPETGEFEPAMGETCKVCWGDDANKHYSWGCECSPEALGKPADKCGADCSNITGRRCAVKRVKYMADPTACCTGEGTSVIGDATCDPKYRDENSVGCKPIMKEWCEASQDRMAKFRCKPYRPADWEGAPRVAEEPAKKGLSGGAIAGIVVGAVVVIALVILIIVLATRKR